MKHGMAYTKEYHIWVAMRNRCYSTNNKHYKNYGGRGITVCDAWKDSFLTFYADMGMCPEKHQLNRINNELGYSKENCEWTTVHKNSRNKRNNRYYTYNGETKILSDWAKEYGLKLVTLKARIDFLGYSFEDALKKEKRTKDSEYCMAGHKFEDGSYTINKSGKRCKICQSIYDRKRRPRKT